MNDETDKPEPAKPPPPNGEESPVLLPWEKPILYKILVPYPWPGLDPEPEPESGPKPGETVTPGHGSVAEECMVQRGWGPP